VKVGNLEKLRGGKKMEKIQSEAMPKDIKDNVPDRSFKVEKNGDVVMTEIKKTVITYSAREFLTFKREHDSQLKEFDHELSPDYKKNMENNKAKLEKEIKHLELVCKDAEEKAAVEYKRKQRKMALDLIKNKLEEFNKPGDHPAALKPLVLKAYCRLEQGEINKLSDEEKSLIENFEKELGIIAAKLKEPVKEKKEESSEACQEIAPKESAKEGETKKEE
jgi:hypothetical protein